MTQDNKTIAYHGYVSSEKNMLERHWDAVHNMGDKKYKCVKCPYSSAEKAKLKYHRISVHNIKGKKYESEKFHFSSVQKGNLKKHKDTVHGKIKTNHSSQRSCKTTHLGSAPEYWNSGRHQTCV